MLRLGLESSGHDVVEADEGGAGLAAHRRSPVDVVITDIVMPGMEGLETIREFRRRFPQLKIIAISAGGKGSRDEYLGVARHLGANRTLAKPFSIDRLTQLAREVLAEN